MPSDTFPNEANGSLVFVGSPMFFPDSLIRFVQAEFATVRLLRVPSLRALAELTKVGKPPQLCVLDEQTGSRIGSDLPALNDACGDATVAMAYYQSENARRVFHRGRQTGRVDIGFVPMAAHMDIWLAALRIQLCGEVFVPSEILGTAPLVHASASDRSTPAGRLRTADQEPKTPLTDRELQVLELVSCGIQNKSIADELGLSEHTVKLHIHHVLGKLKVRNRTGATTWFIQNRERYPVHKRTGV